MSYGDQQAIKKLRQLYKNLAATYARPADTTAYTAGDLVANNTTAGSVAPMSFVVAAVAGASVALRRVRLRKTTTTLTNAAFRLHLFSASPTVTNGDNGAIAGNVSATYLGNFVVGSMLAWTDGAVGYGVPSVGSEIGIALGAGLTTIYGIVEALAAYAPGNAESFTWTLESVEQ